MQEGSKDTLVTETTHNQVCRSASKSQNLVHRNDGKSPTNTERLAQVNCKMPEKQKQWLSEREKEKGNEHFRYVIERWE